jgi:hypothetical protein
LTHTGGIWCCLKRQSAYLSILQARLGLNIFWNERPSYFFVFSCFSPHFFLLKVSSISLLSYL